MTKDRIVEIVIMAVLLILFALFFATIGRPEDIVNHNYPAFSVDLPGCVKFKVERKTTDGPNGPVTTTLRKYKKDDVLVCLLHGDLSKLKNAPPPHLYLSAIQGELIGLIGASFLDKKFQWIPMPNGLGGELEYEHENCIYFIRVGFVKTDIWVAVVKFKMGDKDGDNALRLFKKTMKVKVPQRDGKEANEEKRSNLDMSRM